MEFQGEQQDLTDFRQRWTVKSLPAVMPKAHPPLAGQAGA
jgi:hypothetical protein